MKKFFRMIFLMFLTTVLVLGLNTDWQFSIQKVVAIGPCDSPANQIVAENCLPGNPASEWDVSGDGSPDIQGFATDISYNKNQIVNFKIKVNSSATNYRLDIYRIGYYGGNGARKITTVSPTTSQIANARNQPACITNSSTALYDCGNWNVSGSWTIPSNITSGIFVAKATLTGGLTGSSHIVFIVRDDASTSDILFQTSDTTWQAYNKYGGANLYSGGPGPQGGAYKVSYNRPFNTRTVDNGQDWLFNAEYPMVRWLEANGYDVSYFTGIDSDRYGDLIQNHKLFLSVGHDEYWSKQQRQKVEAARDNGVNLAFFSGNEVYWKTRWENSIDASSTPYRTLVCYKETHAGAKIDPSPEWTGTWRDPRFSPPADGGRPENALTGTLFTVNAGATTAIQVPAEDGKVRFWRNTSIANLAPGSTATLTDNTLGYEWDEDIDNGFRPAGSIRMSTTTVNNAPILTDFGSNFGSGTAIHHLTLYKYKGSTGKNALVFGSGTVQWSWGLDGNHDRGTSIPNLNMQQATVNLFADMNVQPATIQSGLVLASASADLQTPISTITSPANGANFQVNTTVTITGTANDLGGGIVGGVEVSVDNGATWHPANGRGNWSYVWQPTSNGTYTIKSRAIDDSGNIETLPSNVTVTIQPRCNPNNLCTTIWEASTVPKVLADSETNAVEIGVKFRSQINGYITGLRFYKSTQNTGTHVGTLWNSNGTQLARATFTNETASGWQQVNFSSPVAITANTTYVASYHTNVGRYSIDGGYFANSGVDSYPLYALSNGEGNGNGVYAYNANPTFPNSSFNSSNYWVDVVFASSLGPDTTLPTVTATTPANNATGVSSNSSITVAFSEAIDPATINSNTFELRNASNSALVTASITYNSSNNTALLTPTAALASNTTYTATLKGGTTDPRVKDTAGNALAANYSWSFTTAVPDTTPPTVTATTPSSSTTEVNVGTSITATFSEAIDPTTINNNTFELRNSSNTLITATVTYNSANNTATLTPSSLLAASTSYTATLKGGATSIKDVAGNALATNYTWSFTTGAAASFTIWNSTVTPAVLADPETDATEVGVKFRANVPGKIIGIRFYKSSSNTGTHVGTLWSSTGTQLGRATFTNETASGWQQVNFATPVSIAANTVYVASYHTNVGRYSIDKNYFNNAGVSNTPLYALRNGESGSNGVYRYSSTPAFPNSSFQSSNYWVDVVFTPN